MQNTNNLESSKYMINYTTEKFKEISQINETSESQDGGVMGLVPDNVRLNWDNTPDNRRFRFPDENFVTYAGFGVVDPNQETEWSDEAVSYAAERLAYAFISSVTNGLKLGAPGFLFGSSCISGNITFINGLVVEG